MNHVITYNKTLQERLQEYTDVLGGYETLDVSQITSEWAFFLEITVDITGWQAIWKIPRITCEKLNIEFPTLALVYVDSVCFSDLSAHVAILLVDEETELTKKHIVPLIQLWPTEKQDETICLTLSTTANAIDMLRFFYINLVRPWDDEDASLNWFNKHLVSRLKLYYDLRNGTIAEDMAAHIKGRLSEARHIQESYEQVIEAIDLEESITPDLNTQSLVVQKFVGMRVRLMQIRNELELIENPLLRNVIISESCQKQVTKELKQVTYWIVFEQGPVTNFLPFLQKLQSDVGDPKVKFQSTFALALEHASIDDTIFLCDGKHVFINLEDLQKGVTIKGINSTLDVVLSSTNEDIVLDCRGTVVLENLYIDIGVAQCGILVRSGVVILKNCTIAGEFKSSTQQGIIVLAGSELQMDNCKIKGFFNAIVVNSGAVLSLKNSTISDVNCGLKCYDRSDISIESSTFKDCQKYGIFIEMDNQDINKIGNFEMLLGFKGIKVENLVGENNGKGNLKINHKCQLEPIFDLFSNPALNPTIIHDSEEEEEEEDDNDVMKVSELNSNLETTVIEMNVSS